MRIPAGCLHVDTLLCCRDPDDPVEHIVGHSYVPALTFEVDGVEYRYPGMYVRPMIQLIDPR